MSRSLSPAVNSLLFLASRDMKCFGKVSARAVRGTRARYQRLRRDCALVKNNDATWAR